MMGESSVEVLQKAGLTLDDITLLIPHQANLRIIQAVGERIGLPEDRVYVNVHRYGNMSAATIPIALCEAAEEGRLKEDSVVVCTAFGAGLTWAAAALVWGGV